MKKLNIYQSRIQKININDVIIPDVAKKIYDYSNRESEIDALVESISELGQLKPIDVLRDGNEYINLDGAQRQMAMTRLNLNEIDAIVHEFVATDEFSLADLIIHYQIRKQKTNIEKLNEVKTLLRIDSEDKNPLRDKEKRVTLISSLLGGKGWGRNNIFSLENILRWEKKTSSGGRFSDRVISNEITVNKALEAIRLIDNPLFNKEMEEESQIVAEYLNGKYSAAKAAALMVTYDRKKKEGHTVVKQHPIEKRNFTILQGNIEEINLPDDMEIDTIFTSPPYYRLVKYGDDPNELGWEKNPEEYIHRLCNILMKGYNKLKVTGSMFVNLGETYDDGECLGITQMLIVEMKRRGVRYVDTIIWKKDTNKPYPNQVKRLNQGYEVIIHFVKSKSYHFDRFKIKKSKNLKVSKGCKEKGSNEIRYHIPNNYNQFRNLINENEVSNVLDVQINRNRTKHIDGEQIHPATFTSNLPVIPLLISTPKNKDSVVFDPFMGSGSCGLTALMLGFKFVGVELYDKNIQTATRILSEGQDSFDQDSLNSLLEDFSSPDDSEELESLIAA